MSVVARMFAAIGASDDTEFSRILNEVTDSNQLNKVDDDFTMISLDEKDKISPLHLMCKLNKSDFVKALLEKGANANCSSGRLCRYPIHLAVLSQTDDTRCIELLCQFGADINAVDVFRFTALHYACRGNNVAIVEFLLVRNAKLDLEDDSGITPLLYAMDKGNEYLITRLVEAGCDVSCTEGKPIEALIDTGLEFNDSIKLLIEHSANLDKYKQRYFLSACKNENIEMMHFLKSFGVDLNNVGRENIPPLVWACFTTRRVSVEVLKLLLEWGARTDFVIDMFELTPGPVLGLDKLLVLLDYSPDIRSKNIFGVTPLGRLSKTSRTDYQEKAVRLLLAAGARVTEEEIQLFEEKCCESVKILKAKFNQPAELKDLCRTNVRLCLNTKISEKVKLLPIPTPLKEFLMFKDII